MKQLDSLLLPLELASAKLQINPKWWFQLKVNSIGSMDRWAGLSPLNIDYWVQALTLKKQAQRWAPRCSRQSGKGSRCQNSGSALSFSLGTSKVGSLPGTGCVTSYFRKFSTRWSVGGILFCKISLGHLLFFSNSTSWYLGSVDVVGNISRNLTFFQNEVIILKGNDHTVKVFDPSWGSPDCADWTYQKGKCCVWQHWEGSFQTLTLGRVLIKSPSCYVLKSIMPFVPKTLFPRVACS